MRTIVFHRERVLLTCAIATAAFFTTLIFLDYLQLENNTIAAAREFFLVPFFLMLLVLPFILYISIATKKFDQRVLVFAVIIWIGTLLLIIIKTFFLY